MHSAQVKLRIMDLSPMTVFIDGYDSALVGYARIFGMVVAVYDWGRCLQILMDRGMSHTEAEEHMNREILGRLSTLNGPAFSTVLRPPVAEEPAWPPLPAGATGLCSAHQFAEDPGCSICYPPEEDETPTLEDAPQLNPTIDISAPEWGKKD